MIRKQWTVNMAKLVIVFSALLVVAAAHNGEVSSETTTLISAVNEQVEKLTASIQELRNAFDATFLKVYKAKNDLNQKVQDQLLQVQNTAQTSSSNDMCKQLAAVAEQYSSKFADNSNQCAAKIVQDVTEQRENTIRTAFGIHSNVILLKEQALQCNKNDFKPEQISECLKNVNADLTMAVSDIIPAVMKQIQQTKINFDAAPEKVSQCVQKDSQQFSTLDALEKCL